MDCPREIAEVVMAILEQRIVRIRAFATSQQAKKCLWEADHLHNLPAIMSDYRPERLRFYWEVERPTFMAQIPEEERRELTPLWERLERLIPRDAPKLAGSKGVPELKVG